MTFNFGLLRDIRLKDGISRSDFADLLGISEDRLYRFERGQSEPKLGLIEKISYYSGIAADNFFTKNGAPAEKPNEPSKIVSLLSLVDRLNKARFEKKMEEDKVLELERLTEHLLYVNELHGKLVGILRSDAPKEETLKKIIALARTAAKEGEMRFCEIACIFRVSPTTLEHWLESEKVLYSCRLNEGKTAMASTPGEAEMYFTCFDCEAREKDVCRGYGDASYPEDFFVLVAQLEANGVRSRLDQAKYLAEVFKIDVSPQQISEYLSRKKYNKPVPEDIVDLKPRKRT
jgi:transcriptional regulator with XRE-family HTH domain